MFFPPRYIRIYLDGINVDSTARRDDYFARRVRK